MKKIVLVFAAIIVIAAVFTSCKEAKKEVKEEKVEAKEAKVEAKEAVAQAVYQCPMDCEDGKTYDKPGSCPVCKMDLKEKVAEKESGEKHEGHEH